MFRSLAAGTPLLSESPETAEPWTKKGTQWGGDGVGGGSAEQPRPPLLLPGARAMVRLCLSKGLSIQSWSVNGLVMGSLGEMRQSIMQVVMQEHMLLGQLVGQGLVSDKTKDVYSRALKHSGDKVHPRIHPAFTETLADAKVSDLSSSDAVELFVGNMSINNEEGGESAEPPLYGRGGGLDWLHPSGTSDYAKGLSVVSVVDPSSRKGLRALEQALLLLVSENGSGGGGGPEEKADGPSGVSLSDNDNDDGAENGGAGDGVTIPRSGLRLAIVFDASSSSPERSGGGGGGGVPAAGGGRWWLPAVFETVGSRSPDKSPRFLLSVTRAAMSSPGPDGKGKNAADTVETLAREAGLSPSLRAAVTKAAAGGEASSFARRRMARLARSVAGTAKGESCALVNGRSNVLRARTSPRPNRSTHRVLVD
ncbi:unnamed protein product [Ectocarpus sp. 4 AP-2014]